MPVKRARIVVRFVRDHLLAALFVGIAVQTVLLGVGFYRYANLANGFIANQQSICETGNEVRAHIRTLTTTLRDLIDVSLAIPADRTLTPRELAARGRLTQTFSRASKALTRRLPALAPRECSLGAITSAPDEPAR